MGFHRRLRHARVRREWALSKQEEYNHGVRVKPIRMKDEYMWGAWCDKNHSYWGHRSWKRHRKTKWK